MNSINIKKYKIFEDLKLNNLGKVNLIVGPNNIGKTALLEVVELLMSRDIKYLKNIILKIVKRRDEEIKDLNFEIKNENKSIKVFPIEGNDFFEDIQKDFPFFPDMKILEERFIRIEYNVNDNLEIGYLPLNIISSGYDSSDEVIFLPSCSIDNKLLVKFYSNIVENRQKENLIEQLKLFDSSIEDIELLAQNKFKLFLEDIKKPISLSSMGEGLGKFLEITCVFLNHNKNCILIDEIENGIYYKNFELLIKTIFEFAYKFNKQVFITTHSKEIIDMFCLKSRDFEGNARIISLFKKENKINSIVYNEEEFSFLLENKQDLR